MPTLEELRRMIQVRSGGEPEGKSPHHEPEVDSKGRRVSKMAERARINARRGKYDVVKTAGHWDAILKIGQHRGSKVSNLAQSPQGVDYLRWMLRNDFPEELNVIIKQWLPADDRETLMTLSMNELAGMARKMGLEPSGWTKLQIVNRIMRRQER